MDLITIVGLSGSLISLIAFLLNQMKYFDIDDVRYDFMNFAGSLCLFLYSVSLNSIPFLIINVVWGLFSLKDVILYFVKPKTKNASGRSRSKKH